MKTDYTLDDFDYELPSRLIAQKPTATRDGSRLLVFDRSSGSITDDTFANLEKHLNSKTTIAVNNSKVEECRLLFNNKEIFVLKAMNDKTIEALVRPGRSFRQGKTVQLTKSLMANVDAVLENGNRILSFSKPLDDTEIIANQHVPLPPYIAQDDSLKERYQTLYAKPLGSKAAPTAGLHFSDGMLQRLKSTHAFAEITLHVGLGTFAPIDEATIQAKKLHAEYFEVGQSAQEVLEAATHITAVGTTTLRALESAFSTSRVLTKRACETDIFIQPGYDFKMVDSLITNFHLPKSSLLMLVSAFMGYDDLRRVYRHATDNEYRFFSFGDAMLIL